MSDYMTSANLTVKNFGVPPDVGDVPTDGEDNSGSPTASAPQGGFPGFVPAPTARASRNAAPQPQTCPPGFTLVDGDCRLFAKEYAPKMDNPKYIGDTDMLLKYLLREERRHCITMPIRACGIAPIVFENVEHIEMGEGQPQNFFTISEESRGDEEETQHVYELITVDNELYLSCVSECLDEDYLHRVITEATTTMRETGSFIFRMVGLRRLAVESEGEPGRLLETLRLNTFEMSALCSYMSDFGVEPTFEIIEGHQCICFRSR